MMKRHHKYFRKERYKQKLERSVDKHHTYYSNVYFTTKEPDSRYLCEYLHKYRSCGWWKEADEEWIKKHSIPDRGRDTFTYYKRPEVPYSIRYYDKKKGRSKHQTFLKKRTSRRVRQKWKQYGEVYQHNEYRKTTEFWWDLD